MRYFLSFLAKFSGERGVPIPGPPPLPLDLPLSGIPMFLDGHV